MVTTQHWETRQSHFWSTAKCLKILWHKLPSLQWFTHLIQIYCLNFVQSNRNSYHFKVAKQDHQSWKINMQPRPMREGGMDGEMDEWTVSPFIVIRRWMKSTTHHLWTPCNWNGRHSPFHQLCLFYLGHAIGLLRDCARYTMRTLRAYYGAFSHCLPPYVYPLHWALLLHAMWGLKTKQLAKTRDPRAPPHFQVSGTA